MSQRCLRSALVLAAGLLAAVSASGADNGGKVHVLLVLDTQDAKIGGTVQIDEKNVTKFLTDGIPEARRSFKILKDGDITPENIRAYYRALNVNAGRDTVLFYYSGHGATDPQRGHYLNTKGKAFLRSALSSVLAAKKPALTVILTDCCASIQRLVPLAGAEAAERAKLQAVLAKLFLASKGVIDWNACARGELAKCNAGLGGFFTAALITECNAAALANETVSWEKLFPRVVSSTHYLNPGQTPAVMNGNGGQPLSERGIRILQLKVPLHVELYDREGAHGLIITKVLANGPADQAGIKEGDVIVTINGARMTYREYDDFRHGRDRPADARFVIAERCGCGCGKLHVNCKRSCKWDRGRAVGKCAED
jgi:hypothetical protein